MTSIRTLSEKESKEDTKFGVEIEQFYLQFWHREELYEITKENLKDFYSIYLVGLND